MFYSWKPLSPEAITFPHTHAQHLTRTSRTFYTYAYKVTLHLTDSNEAAAKDLLPEQRAAHAERQAGTMPRKDSMSSTSMSATLYPDWVLSRAGRRMSPDMPQLYRMPREDDGRPLTLEEKLDASSVFDPLQSSQGAEGPWTLPHYSETPTYIPQFDIAKVGVLPKMSPIMDQENERSQSYRLFEKSESRCS